MVSQALTAQGTVQIACGAKDAKTARNGFIWGGKWSEFDLMHFEYRPELILLARLTRGENLPLADIHGLVKAVR